MPGEGGFVLWEGASQYDGAPLVVIVTTGGTNRKTGPMDQSWILRSDVHPFHATRTREDVSVCGDCRHRGTSVATRSCYVTTQHGPAAVWRAYHKGLYPEPQAICDRITGRFLRFGAYGDPAVVPVEVWASMLPFLKGWTGYTHLWRICDQAYRQFLMASVDTIFEQGVAQAMGWRTFRVRHTGAKLLPQEIVCPASAEAGHRLTCIECRICSGALSGRSTKHVAIYSHGVGKINFFKTAQEALEF